MGEDYNIFDKDGNLIGQAKDQKDLEGYVLVSSENEGNLLKFEGGYRAEYFEGDAGKPVQAKDDSGMTPLARGVFLELDRKAAASLTAIHYIAEANFFPITLITGSGLARGGITTLGLAGRGTATAATIHGGVQLAVRGFTEADIALTKTGVQLLQRDGATVFLKEVAPGKFNVLVEGGRGVVTALKNLSWGKVAGLARNYGWYSPLK